MAARPEGTQSESVCVCVRVCERACAVKAAAPDESTQGTNEITITINWIAKFSKVVGFCGCVWVFFLNFILKECSGGGGCKEVSSARPLQSVRGPVD